MSVINDALKRAGQKPASSPSASELSAGLETADERSNGFPVLTLVIVLLPLIALGLWFLGKGLELNEPPLPAEIVSARLPEVPPAPVPVAARSTNAATATSRIQPAYKLQGIYWRRSNPSAVVNGKTVYVGDRVENAWVTAIDQESVTIAVDGKAKVLLSR
jgi:hypothetical protein